MRLARKLFLLLAAAIAALAMSATTASATGPVEVDIEGGAHCAPCFIEVHGESQITNATGTPLSTCEDTFHAEIYEDGFGHVTELINAPHATLPCTTIKCTGVGEPPEEAEWPFRIEETGLNQELLEIRFCLDVAPNPGATGLHCDLDAAVTANEVNEPHHYNVSVLNWPCAGGARLVTGNWEIEGRPIEIEHP